MFLNLNLEGLIHNDRSLHKQIVDELEKNNKYRIEKDSKKVEYYDSLIKKEFSNIHKNKIIISYGADLESFYSLGKHVLSPDIEEENECKLIILLETDLKKIIRILSCLDCYTMLKNKMLKIVYCKTMHEYHSRMNAYILKNNLFIKSGLSIGNYLDEDSFSNDISTYVELLILVKKMVFNTCVSLGNNPRDAFVGLDNIISNINIAVKFPCISSYKGKFKDKQAILIAAGPSLSKDLKLLKKLKGKVLLCCVDTAYKTLLDEGFSPDIVIGVERTSTVINYYKDIECFKGYDKNALLCVSSVTDYNVLGYASSRLKPLLHHKNYELLEHLKLSKDCISHGKGVASCALKVLDYMGFSKIYLVGQDLCFQDGKSHAEGEGCEWSSSGVLKSRIGYNKFVAEGNRGTVETTDTWYKFKAVYDKDLRDVYADVVNCTVDGLKIGDIPVMPLKDVKFKPYNVNELIQNNYKKTEEGIEDVTKEAFKKTMEAKGYIYDLLQKVGNIINNEDIDIEEKIEELKKSREAIKENIFYRLIMNVVTNSFEFAIDAQIEKIDKEDRKSLYDLYIVIFDMYAMVSYQVGKMISYQ